MSNSVIVWLSGGFALTSLSSAIILSFQRAWLHKSQQRDPAPLRFDDKRDLASPSSNYPNYQNRLAFGTLVLTLLSASNLFHVINEQQRQENWYLTASYFIQFISWLYASVLVLVSRRYRFPNEWGWILNVHLTIIFSVALCIAFYMVYKSLVLNPDDSWIHMLPTLLSFLLGSDLVYITMTTPKGPPYLDENGKQVIGVNVASIFSILYFQWVTPLVQLAFKKKKLEEKDLPTLPPLFRGYNIYYIFGENRDKGLIRRLYLANRPEIILKIILAVIASSTYYAPALLVNRLLLLIQSMNGKEDPEFLRKGFVIVAALGATIIAVGVIVGQLWYCAGSTVQVRIKSMLDVEIYRKTLRRRDLAIESPKLDKKDEEDAKKDSAHDKDEIEKEDSTSSVGTIVNLMSTDSSRIALYSTWWFACIEISIELILGVCFLYSLLGKSCFLGLLVMVIVLPLNHYNAKIFSRTQDKLMDARDKRVNLMNELLQGIRQIKFFAWEKNWKKIIMEAREVELHHLSITYLSSVIFSFIWQSSTILVSLVTFYSFTKLEGQELTAPIAFTAINVFNEMKFALNALPETIVEWFQALISVRRIQAYLDEEEVEPPREDATQDNSITIGFTNATVGWSLQKYTDEQDDDNEASTFILKDLNFKFPNNELSLISGATGSGKTLMMLGLLGEAFITKGAAHCPRQPVADTVSSDFILSNDIDPKDWILPYSLAYVSQTAWLQNASIRDNILFGLPYVESRYSNTLVACALDKDLEIFEDGDMTEIGEKGITLSGGQKARVSLARAVYSRAQNVFMDDVLSAVDAHTARHLYEKCLLGPLMKNRTRILITHHIKLCIKGSSYIAYINGGRVDLHGDPSKLRQLGKLTAIIESEEEEIVEEYIEEKKAIENPFPADAEYDAKKVKKSPRALVEEEARATGMVKIRLYKMYLVMVGSPVFWFFMTAAILGSRGLDVTEGWWIKQWSHSYDSPSNQIRVTTIVQQQSMVSQLKSAHAYTPLDIVETNAAHTNQLPLITDAKDEQLNFYLGIYALITVSNIIVGILRYAISYYGVLRANRALYAELLQRVFRAPLRFFDTTPIGRILNRFSKDFETIDSEIPNDILNFAIQWVLVISSMMTVTSVLPIFLIPMIILAVINVYLSSMFVSISREIKRIDSVSRSPLFTHFTETIVGITTIRSFGATRLFFQNMLKYVDANARPLYYTWLCDRWISVRLALTGAAINVFTGVIILLSIKSMNASVAGFCLSFVLMFTDQMFWGIRRYTSLEMSFNAVERVVEFMEIDQEAPAITQLRPPAQWPKGKIEVNDLEVRYAADLDPVLKGLTFSVKPQEKIGIVGRTGSGKSTLALSFFRFIEASRGSIVIDGLDIKDLGLEDLRSNLTIIPQDPTLFSGSLRSNLDPFDQFSDADILNALRRVHLLHDEDLNHAEPGSNSSEVNSNVFKDLQATVTEGGKNFSQGQRQLLCLARALLKRSRVVLMDEATASVDFETDKAIQKTISTEFADSTILCIAHRLHTVIEYDRILVLDQGRIVEFDSPLTLINMPESAFNKMCRNSGEFESLVALAKSKYELLDVST